MLDLPPKPELARLLARYDRPLPRYTSYPTAVEFTPDYGRATYRATLHAARAAGQALGAYVHLPFCQSLCTYCGCNVVVRRNPESSEPYLKRLLREIDAVAAELEGLPPLAELHLGGGTPNFLGPKRLRHLIEHLRARLGLAAGAHVAVELDPRSADTETLNTLIDLGLSRASVGVQDFDPTVQAAIGRSQSVAQTAAVLEHLRAAGLKGLNIDLIYGLPQQTLKSFASTLRQVIALAPDRVAIYNFAWVPWLKPHQRRIAEATLPDRDTKFALYDLAIQTMLDAGYEFIGMDHFAKPDDELVVAQRQGRLTRNFQGYSIRYSAGLLGFGMSAIGDVMDTFAQNPRRLRDYLAAVDTHSIAVERGLVRTDDDCVRAWLIERLMCDFSVRWQAIADRFPDADLDALRTDAAALQPMVDDGLVVVDTNGITVSARGRLFVRNVAAAFDVYLRAKGAEAPRFSRAV